MKNNNFLLVIAIDNYTVCPRFKSLNNPVSDAKKMIQVLEKRYNFQEQKYLFNEDATTDEITTAFVELKHLTNEDNLIIFFAGHGTEDPDTHKGQLVPINATKRSEYISYSIIKAEYLDCVKAKHILVIFDCCYSGNFIGKTRSGINVSSSEKIYKIPSRYFLGSGGKETVSDGNEGCVSPFMQHLLDFLNKNEKESFVTAKLALYIRENVGNITRQQPVYEPLSIAGHTVGGEFVFHLADEFINKQNYTRQIGEFEAPEITQKFEKYINESEIIYYHNDIDEVTLDAIFVEPYLKKMELNDEKQVNSLNKRFFRVLDDIEVSDTINFILIGDDTAGKTTLCKMAFNRYYNSGYTPILLNGEKDIRDIRPNKLLNKIRKIFRKQYKSFDFNKIQKNKIILIIDDFDKFKRSNTRYYGDLLLRNLHSIFHNVILTGNITMPLEIMTNNNKVKSVFEKYEIYQILAFGVQLRQELMTKWYAIGKKDYIDQNRLFRQYDEREKQIKQIIGKNYMPAYPIYILTILQTIENKSDVTPNYSLYGFYYQVLVDKQLSLAVKNKDDILLYENYMAEFSFFLFSQKEKNISIEVFEEFHDKYVLKYDINYSMQVILQSLCDAKLLSINHNVKIKYEYIYYYFMSKYLNDNISDENIKLIISKMCKRVYRDEYASIIIFLTHLSKDPYIINNILNNAKQICSEYQASFLENDIDSINQLITDIPKQVINLVDASKVRNEELTEKEQIEILERQYNEENNNYYASDIDENIDDLNLIAELKLSFKTIDILGQLTKKYWGSLNADIKYEITTTTYFLGLRVLNKYLSFIEKNTEDITHLIKELVLKKNIKDRYLLRETTEKVTSNYIFRMCFLSSFGVIKRISTSIGHKQLYNTFETVLKNYQKSSIKLINQSIYLDYDKLNIENIKSLYKDLNNNKLAILILRQLVIDRIYYFNESYKDTQKLSEIFGIPIQRQLIISNTSKEKKV